MLFMAMLLFVKLNYIWTNNNFDWFEIKLCQIWLVPMLQNCKTFTFFYSPIEVCYKLLQYLIEYISW